MNRFFHITIVPADGRKIVNELSPVFDNAIDWLRYAHDCWIVLTNTEPEGWYVRLKPYLKDQDAFLICEISLANRHGMMPKAVWDWMNKYPGDGSSLRLPPPKT